MPYLSLISRWDELKANSFSAFNSYSIGLRSYGLLDNCAGDSQNSYGLTHSVQTGKIFEVIKRRVVVRTRILVPVQKVPGLSLMRKTLIYFPLPPKNCGEALSNYDCFLLNLNDVIRVCQEMDIKIIVKWKRGFEQTLERLKGLQREHFAQLISGSKNIFRTGVLEDVILEEQPTWVVANPFSSSLMETDLALKGIRSCYYNNFILGDARYFSSTAFMSGEPKSLFVNDL